MPGRHTPVYARFDVGGRSFLRLRFRCDRSSGPRHGSQLRIQPEKLCMDSESPLVLPEEARTVYYARLRSEKGDSGQWDQQHPSRA
jgi:hypothetical protein